MTSRKKVPFTGFVPGDTPPVADRPFLASYGRRRSRRLTSRKAELMETLLPRLSVQFRDDAALPENRPQVLAATASPIWLEIGFGGGEHLAEQAANHPNALLIGCETFIDGVARLLEQIDDFNLANIRILADDARLLLHALPDACIDRVFILFPDPWPKTRHKTRRIVSKDTLDSLARVLKPGGELRLATDHVEYSQWMLEHVQAHNAFIWQENRDADWNTAPADWVPTRYEKKTRAQGREPVYYLLKRA